MKPLLSIALLACLAATSLAAAQKPSQKAPAKAAATNRSSAAAAAPSPTPTKPATGSRLKMLDPHGDAKLNLKAATLAQHSECKVCHVVGKDGKLANKPDIDDVCFGCHGRLPHSGVFEHMGEEPGGGAGLNCLACHRPHRATMDGSIPEQKSPSILKLNRNSPNLPDTLIERSNPGAMVEHPCSECHDWK